MNNPAVSTELAERFRNVRLFLCDVDGVLTNATVFMGTTEEVKRFHIRDGLGLRFLQHAGIPVGWVSNRPSFATTQRAMDLKVDFMFQADGDKVKAVEVILKQTNLAWEQLCYMGDDIVDLGVIRRAGVGVAVQDALPEAKSVAKYVTERAGGDGAVREVVELILKHQGKWEQLVAHFSK